MARAIVLLRGVNVGGSHRLPMSDLRRGLEEVGCTDVATYIQSGNIVLTPPTPAPKNLEAWLGQNIADVAGFGVPVVLRTLAELERTVARNPYPDAGGTRLHVVCFPEPLGEAALADIDLAGFAPEECTLVGRELYLHLPNGMCRAKLPVVLEKGARRAQSPAGTTRNWNTVLKLVALASG